MNEEDFITKFYSCDNEEQFLKDVNHNLNCLQKVQNNWNELKKWLEENRFKYNITGEDLDEDIAITEVLNKMQELEQGKDDRFKKR